MCVWVLEFEASGSGVWLTVSTALSVNLGTRSVICLDLICFMLL